MRAACAISVDEDKAFISFASFKRSQPIFLQELEIPIINFNGDIIFFLKDNFENLNQKIKEIEKKYSCRCDKIFLEFPWGAIKSRTVEEVIILKTRKKITFRDISRAKKYIEDKFLSWDDFCIHNIVINYAVEGTNYRKAPLGIWAKKIKVQSMLVWTKDKVQKGVEDIFENSDRSLGAIIAPQISRFSSVFTVRNKSQGVVSIDYDQSCFVAGNKNSFIFGKKFNFSFSKIIKELANKFTFEIPLAEEIFQRYVSFKETPYFKEITVKRESGYVNLSIQELNTFIKNYIKGEICYILQEISDDIINEEFTISFMGRLNIKEGFYGFLKDFIQSSLKPPLQKTTVSSSYGCLRYGVFRFLEVDHKNKRSLIFRIFNIYREYF